MFTPKRLVLLAMLLAASVSQPGPTLAQKETADVVKSVDPAVVTILVKDIGLGSGFLIDDKGTIVTNYHVIEGAEQVRVVFQNNPTYEVKGFVAVSTGKDLAIIKIDLSKDHQVEPLKLAAESPSKGEKVLAFGAPQGLSGSVTEGIVSAIRLGSEIQRVLLSIDQRDTYRELGYDLDARWIQTSAPISHGNSGGPLVNMRGEVVGVNTWSEPTGESLNFAISGLHVKDLLDVSELRVRPFSELPAPRPHRLPARPPFAPTMPPIKPYRPGEGTLAEQIAALESHLEQIRKALDVFVVSAEATLAKHPARADYLEAMVKSKAVRAELASVQAQINVQRQAWARTDAQATSIYNDLDLRQAIDLQNSLSEYQRKVNVADPIDVPFIESEFQRQRNLIVLRYDALRADARARYATFADGLKRRIDELTNLKLAIEIKQLAPLMVKAKPYLELVKEVDARRESLKRDITRYSAQLDQLQTRAKRETPLEGEEAEGAAQKALELALSLIDRNPSAAENRLKELAEKYPITAAALKAQELLVAKEAVEPRSPKEEAARTWTSLDGKHQVEAQYLGYKDGKVGLKKNGGVLVVVPLEKLSELDRRYIVGLPAD